MFFDGWYDLIRILLVGSLAYLGLVFFLRVTGKRTLAKMNAFDFIVTVALGSTLATVLLSSEVSLSEGLAALALLCALQYIVALASLHSKSFQALIKAEPSLLFYRGQLLPAMLAKERVTEEEIFAAVREQGFADVSEVGAVVLETDGSFSVVGAQSASKIGTLKHVSANAEAEERTS
jgi:uncharacterized membrane protein YcaP (DUF421 family)